MSDARLNARLNGASNALFVAAGVEDLDTHGLRQLWREAATAETDATAAEGRAPAAAAAEEAPAEPDVVVVDPARGGLSAEATTWLSRCGARRIVYVSCNVATQVRAVGAGFTTHMYSVHVRKKGAARGHPKRLASGLGPQGWGAPQLLCGQTHQSTPPTTPSLYQPPFPRHHNSLAHSVPPSFSFPRTPPGT